MRCGKRTRKPASSRKWIPYHRISNELKRAIIIAEDAKFVDHDGFDWEGIQRALEKEPERGKVVAELDYHAAAGQEPCFLSAERSLVRQGPGGDSRLECSRQP